MCVCVFRYAKRRQAGFPIFEPCPQDACEAALESGMLLEGCYCTTHMPDDGHENAQHATDHSTPMGHFEETNPATGVENYPVWCSSLESEDGGDHVVSCDTEPGYHDADGKFHHDSTMGVAVPYSTENLVEGTLEETLYMEPIIGDSEKAYDDCVVSKGFTLDDWIPENVEDECHDQASPVPAEFGGYGFFKHVTNPDKVFEVRVHDAAASCPVCASAITAG